MKCKPCILVLEDGKFFKGVSFGATGEIFGEVVFNTSMTGYQEILTDPSYSNQIVTMTYPHIGNYGVNKEDVESDKVHVSGFIVKENSGFHSNWRSRGSIEDYLEKNGIVGIEGIDTRALVKHIREAGAMRGAISTNELNADKLLAKVKEWPSLVGRDLVKNVTTNKSSIFNLQSSIYKVAVYDFGVKNNILNCLRQEGCDLTIFPASTSYEEILSAGFDGLFLSNGPGDPAAVDYAIENVKNLLGKLPIFGICLGHQILALALGAETYKLKFGHRGANQPVKNLAKGSVEITSQNHGFAVKASDDWQMMPRGPVAAGNPVGAQPSLRAAWEPSPSRHPSAIYISHKNLNDETIEGISVPELKAFSVQYHPESSPGPHDSRYLFKQFIELMKGESA